MRPVDTLESQIEGDLGGEKIAMKIDENSIAHIMSILTDLYSDAELAVVREYSANARDSHIEAGKEDVPIVVDCPTDLMPYFVVKDQGVGLSLNDVIEIYSQYGASTKRDSDPQTGMLGLGCKSALTYTSQFVVVGVKEGMKTQIVVRRAEDGTGVMEILGHDPTDEPNGVEIKVPVQYGSTITQKAKNFFRFWKPGTVLLNGEEPSGLDDEQTVKLSDDILVTRNILDQDYIVMGSVPYPANSELANDIFGDRNVYGRTPTNVVAYVNMGDVTFPPSREELAYTPRTKQTILNLRETIVGELEKVVRADINKAATHAEAIATYKRWTKTVNSSRLPDDLTWNGIDIEMTYKMAGVHHQPGKRNYGTYKGGEFTYDELTDADSILVTGYDVSDTPNAAAKRKIKKYLEDNHNGFWNKTLYFFQDEIPGSPWTDHLKSIDWEDIKAVRFPRSLGGLSGSRPIQQYVKVGNSWAWQDISELDDDARIAFTSPAEKNTSNTLRNIVSANPDVVVLSLGKNRWNKLQRLFKNAKYYVAVHREILQEMKDALTEDQITAYKHNQSEQSFVKAVDYAGLTLDDPAFDEVRRLSAIDTTSVIRYNNLAQYGSTIPGNNDNLVFDKYPLLPEVSSYRISDKIEDMVIYANAAYAARKDKS